MNILVTGANGFIGQWVVKELEAVRHKAIPFLKDITKEELYIDKPVEAVIHLAALITHRQNFSSQQLYDVNVTGTKNILKAYPAAKMVYISTTDILRSEISDYANTKLEAEKIVARRGNYVIIRLPSVFGPGQRQNKLIRLLFMKYCWGTPCVIQNNETREYIYVRDAARQIVSSIDKTGIISLQGYKISNQELDMMIKTVCGQGTLDEACAERRHFFSSLKECLPAYSKMPDECLS
jgi:nucleoside-diphosphate-sugar epimerase